MSRVHLIKYNLFSVLVLAFVFYLANGARINEKVAGMEGQKIKHPFKSPTGLFIQERASKQLPGPGQHFSFGALVSWDDIHRVLDSAPDSKLLLVVRHGEAISNWVSNELGPDEWFKFETTCSYHDPKTNFDFGLFDADLTSLGLSESHALNMMLQGGGWFSTFRGNHSVRAIVSPLSRCLRTASHVLDGLDLAHLNVEETIRETLGEDTCDARRAVSDYRDLKTNPGPCAFKKGLYGRFPNFDFPITKPEDILNDPAFAEDVFVKEKLAPVLSRKSVESAEKATKMEMTGEAEDGVEEEEEMEMKGTGNDTKLEETSTKLQRKKKKHHDSDDYDSGSKSASRGFGMISDVDLLWTTARENQKQQVYRATHFLNKLFRFATERVVIVVTHTGFTRSLLLAVGREPYRPQNTELVPVIVQRHLI